MTLLGLGEPCPPLGLDFAFVARIACRQVD